jgi:hypothetical protein
MAMKTAVELVEGLRCELRMMGCPVDGPTCIKADNTSVVHNCSTPESVLKKKSNSVAFHFCREHAAMGVCSMGWIPMDQNLSDMLTKLQPGPMRIRLIEQVLF